MKYKRLIISVLVPLSKELIAKKVLEEKTALKDKLSIQS